MFSISFMKSVAFPNFVSKLYELYDMMGIMFAPSSFIFFNSFIVFLNVQNDPVNTNPMFFVLRDK